MTQKTYPESSARQALRKFRRGQGGPGITEGKDPQPKQQVNLAPAEAAVVEHVQAEMVGA